MENLNWAPASTLDQAIHESEQNVGIVETVR